LVAGGLDVLVLVLVLVLMLAPVLLLVMAAVALADREAVVALALVDPPGLEREVRWWVVVLGPRFETSGNDSSDDILAARPMSSESESMLITSSSRRGGGKISGAELEMGSQSTTRRGGDSSLNGLGVSTNDCTDTSTSSSGSLVAVGRGERARPCLGGVVWRPNLDACIGRRGGEGEKVKESCLHAAASPCLLSGTPTHFTLGPKSGVLDSSIGSSNVRLNGGGAPSLPPARGLPVDGAVIVALHDAVL